MHVRWLQMIVIALALLAATACGAEGGEADTGPAGGRDVVLATTTSTQDTGLLDELVPMFERLTGYRVKTIAVGSGQALELGGRGEADVVLVHSPKAEREFMHTGAATERRLVMHNRFLVVGPEDDPAGVRDARDAVDAVRRIAAAEAPFISRGDDSGTNRFELSLWEEAGIEPGESWYQESGQGMAQTLQIAAEKEAYTISDDGTYVVTRESTGLAALNRGGAEMLNIYHVMPIAADAGPHVNANGGLAFARFVVSKPAQELIAEVGADEYGRPLFDADAGERVAEVIAAG
jgi:tungstate transport system substrate-binding protein